MNQSFPCWEMLILDNGSTDASVAALKEYEKKDGRIRCLFLKQNVGWCRGISICLKRAQGKYMMFLGADDYLATEHTLQEVAAEIEKYKPQIVWTGCGFAIFESGKHEIVAREIFESGRTDFNGCNGRDDLFCRQGRICRMFDWRCGN